eukprot:Blabericola_migrator_1__560@NODE_1139_length_5305_cov_64_109393_g775_i0_p1_GENE_NODE_1139_length_5305_cov_64_109393_g775_i0NODE_1139_length_5305_cov_64_109393_g775_i0_p1_ORF_typecomplete_len1007_score117_41DUF1467/PF07330_12/13DUF1467/PF07330_12/41AvrPto/PF11592_8/0_67AvrPto/PF11592_8/5_1e03_NODE_1139_length_5305_cov_64_109393_g775_i016624682
MRGLRAEIQRRWLINGNQLLYGAAALAVLPLRVSQSAEGGDVWSSVGTDNSYLLTTPAPPKYFVSQRPYLEDTPTASPSDRWSFQDDTQHCGSDGVPGVAILQRQPTTSCAVDPRVFFPPSDTMLFCSSHSNVTNAFTTGIREQWPVSVGPANGYSVLDSPEQHVSKKTTDDVSYRGVATEHSAFQEPPVEANANLQPSNHLGASEKMTSLASLPPFKSLKRCHKSESHLRSPKEPQLEEVARLISEEPVQSVEILEHLMDSLNAEGQDCAWEVLEPFHNDTQLRMTHDTSHTGRRELVRNLSGFSRLTGDLDQASASDDLQPNIMDSTEALKGSQGMQIEQVSAQSPQTSTKSVASLYHLTNRSFDDVENEKMLTTMRAVGTSLIEPSHGTTHLKTPLIHSSPHSNSPATASTRPNPTMTSIEHDVLLVDARIEPPLGCSNSMGYIQQLDESGNICLHPVSYADYPAALPFNHFPRPEIIPQIVLPQDPNEYLEALYNSVRRFRKKYVGSTDTASNQQCDDANSDPTEHFRLLRVRSARRLAAHQWVNLIQGVESWLRERPRGTHDAFAHFAVDYFKTMNRWRFYEHEPTWCKAMVAAWCEKHRGLSEALRLVATQNHCFLRGCFLITLPDIYLKTCPYFLMYAVHHPGPKRLSNPGTSTGGGKSSAPKNFRVQLLHELTTAAYLWQMVLHVRGEADRPEWPSDPPIAQKVMQRNSVEDKAEGTQERGIVFDTRMESKRSGQKAHSITLTPSIVLNEPLNLGRFDSKLLAQIQATESSVMTPPRDASDLHTEVGSFLNGDAMPLTRGRSAARRSPEDFVYAKDELLESFWRLRVLFQAKMCAVLRYQIDKLIMETESKMKSGVLPEDRFLRFACGYLRVMRIWDSLMSARRIIKMSPEETRKLFRHLSDTYKVTGAVKKVAEWEPMSKGPRMLPTIYKNYPASSLLPYVTWCDTKKPEAIMSTLRLNRVTTRKFRSKEVSGKKLKAMMLRLLTIIAEIWERKEGD